MTHKFLDAVNFIEYVFSADLASNEREEARDVINKFNDWKAQCCNSGMKYRVQDLDESYVKFAGKLIKVGDKSKLLIRLFALLSADSIIFENKGQLIAELFKKDYAES